LRWEEVFGLEDEVLYCSWYGRLTRYTLEKKDQKEETVRAIQVLSILSRFKRRKWPCFCIRTE
jgi:hypothetical protein